MKAWGGGVDTRQTMGLISNRETHGTGPNATVTCERDCPEKQNPAVHAVCPGTRHAPVCAELSAVGHVRKERVHTCVHVHPLGIHTQPYYW